MNANKGTVRWKYLLIAALLMVVSITAPTTAYASDEVSERIDYEDGSYAIVTVHTAHATRSTASDSKEYIFYNRSSELQFIYTIYATFSYNGVTSSATSCKGYLDFYTPDWSCDSHDEYTSGNTAYGDASFSSTGGLTVPVSLSLTCSRNGTIK